MYRNRKREGLKPISELLDTAAVGRNMKSGFKKHAIWYKWKSIMPEPIASQTRPLRWNGDALVIGTPTSAWSQEMTYMKPEILEKIREHFPKLKIRDLLFETGIERPSNKQKDESFYRRPLSNEEMEKINGWANTTSNEELRETMKKALKSALSRR